jgi:flavodoxin short chain
MSKILIVYGSTTGNTEMVAEQIANNLKAEEPEVQDVLDTEPQDLGRAPILLVGASTWDDGLLQQDFREFLQDLDVDLSQTRVAIFALGDTSYPKFCQSAAILKEKFTALGAKLMSEPLKIDGFPDDPDNQESIDTWCEELRSELS